MIKKRLRKILIWSQRYTKTDMLYIAKGGVWITSLQIVNILTSLTLSILFSKILTQEMYGAYKYILSLGATIGVFTLSGIYTVVTKEAALKNTTSTLASSFNITLKWNLINSLLILLPSAYYFIKGNLIFGSSLLIIAIFTPILQSSTIYTNFLVGKKDFKRSSIYQIIYFIVPALLIGISVLTKNIVCLIGAYYISYSITALILYYYTLKQSNTPQTDLSKESTTLAKKLSTMDWIGGTANFIDKILVFHFLGPINLAIYTFATMPIDQLFNIIKQIIRNLAFPKIIESTVEHLKKTLLSKLLRIVLFTIPFIGIYQIISPLFYHFIFPQYTESIPFTQIYSLILLSFSTSFLMDTITAHSTDNTLYKIHSINLVTKTTLLLILLPQYSLLGAVLSILGAKLVQFLTALYYFKKLSTNT